MRSQAQILLLTNSGVQDITCCVQKEVRAHGITEADEKMVKIRVIEYMDVFPNTEMMLHHGKRTLYI